MGMGMALKRVIDILGAGFGLITAIIPMAIIAMAVAVAMGRPVLFRQERIGRYGRRFDMLKFRTMTDERTPDGTPLPDEKRTTKLGTLLRRFRLDEIPELWTILIGDMSLVGPRPLPPYIQEPYVQSTLARTSERDTGAKRAEMPPGLTGYAQVCGGILLTMDEKFALDGWYVDHWSLALDLWVAWKTLAVVASGEKRDEERIARALDHGSQRRS